MVTIIHQSLPKDGLEYLLPISHWLLFPTVYDNDPVNNENEKTIANVVTIRNKTSMKSISQPLYQILQCHEWVLPMIHLQYELASIEKDNDKDNAIHDNDIISYHKKSNDSNDFY